MGNLLYVKAKELARTMSIICVIPKKIFLKIRHFYLEIRTFEQFSIIQKESDDNKDMKG